MMTPEYFNIVLLGAPGSGKGTQAHLLEQRYPLKQISTGELYRKEIALGSPVGIKAKRLIDRGHLCPDEMTLDLLFNYCTTLQNVRGFILDGVPRTLVQAKMMDGIGYRNTIPVTVAVYIKIEEHEIIERLLKRALLENRTDDNLDVIRKRVEHYETLTKPLVSHYRAQNKLIKINGMQTVEEVFADICKKIDPLLSF
jgi:adenylate kinase